LTGWLPSRSITQVAHTLSLHTYIHTSRSITQVAHTLSLACLVCCSIQTLSLSLPPSLLLARSLARSLALLSLTHSLSPFHTHTYTHTHTHTPKTGPPRGDDFLQFHSYLNVKKWMGRIGTQFTCFTSTKVQILTHVCMYVYRSEAGR